MFRMPASAYPGFAPVIPGKENGLKRWRTTNEDWPYPRRQSRTWREATSEALGPEERRVSNKAQDRTAVTAPLSF